MLQTPKQEQVINGKLIEINRKLMTEIFHVQAFQA